MISFHNVNKTYPGGFLALKQVNFTLQAGEMAFLTGHSGAGKSTLLQIIGTLEKPDSGSIEVNSNLVKGLQDKKLSDFRNKETILSRSNRILARTQAKSMPPPSSGGSLTDEEIESIECWVDDGANG